MNEIFDNKLVASFLLFIDNKILSKGNAYTNVSTRFYPSETKTLGLTTFNAPYRQIVADTSISGANILSGIYVNNVFLNRGTSGLMLDFNNGRAIFTGSPSYSTISGSYAIKDFNIYYTTDAEEHLLFETKFELKPKVSQTITGLMEPSKSYPAVYIKYNPGQNEPFAFGGQDETISEFRCIILSDSVFKLDAICSILRDVGKSYFPLLSSDELPFNEYGDIKSGDFYNYQTLTTNKAGNDIIYIEKAQIKKFREIVNNSINSQVFGAFADFRLSIPRYPRQ